MWDFEGGEVDSKVAADKRTRIEGIKTPREGPIIRSRDLLSESLTQEKPLAVSVQYLSTVSCVAELESRRGDECACTARAGKRSKALKLDSAEMGMTRLG